MFQVIRVESNFLTTIFLATMLLLAVLLIPRSLDYALLKSTQPLTSIALMYQTVTAYLSSVYNKEIQKIEKICKTPD